MSTKAEGRKTHTSTHTHTSQSVGGREGYPPTQGQNTHAHTQAHIATVKCQATFTRVDKYEASSCGSQEGWRGVAGGNGKRQHIERFNVLSAWALPSPTNPPRERPRPSPDPAQRATPFKAVCLSGLGGRRPPRICPLSPPSGPPMLT